MATYYVDPGSGLDSNAGTSQLLAWKTIPGTRTVNNAGFLNAAWGAISVANKLSAGDSIRIKAGTTHSSANGGGLLISSSYYNNGTSGSKIAIVVANDWGSGNFVYDGSGITNTSDAALVWITQRNHITISGANSTTRFLVKNAAGSGVVGGLRVSGVSATHSTGCDLNFIEATANAYTGINAGWTDSATWNDCLGHTNGSSTGAGFMFGDLSDHNCNAITCVNCIAHNNGPSGTDIRHGFQGTSCTNMRFESCTSYSNGRDGYDFGIITSGTTSATFLNCTSYSNGEDGWGLNDQAGNAGTVTFYLINCVSQGNSNGTQIYDGPIVFIYHSVFFSNVGSGSFGGNILTYRSAQADKAPAITIRDSYFGAPTTGSAYHIGTYVGSGVTSGARFTIDSNNNIYAGSGNKFQTSAIAITDMTFAAAQGVYLGAADINNTQAFVDSASTPGNFRLANGTGFANNNGIYLSSPSDVLFDRDGVARANPPDIGAYEFGAAVAPDNETWNWDTSGVMEEEDMMEVAMSDPLSDDLFAPIYIPVYNEL